MTIIIVVTLEHSYFYNMELNAYIDHTLLHPTASESEIIQLCQEAISYKFYAVCVNSCHVPLAVKTLKDSNVKVCSVVGFPLGAASTNAKAVEAKHAVAQGANEIDMVLNIGWLKSMEYNKVWKDIESVKNSIPNTVVKVILETCYLEDKEIIKASELAIQCGAEFIKTSTGFGTGGATIHDVKLMLSVAKNSTTKVKASGGIRDYATAKKYIDLGVERLGVSSGIAIIKGEKSDTGY